MGVSKEVKRIKDEIDMMDKMHISLEHKLDVLLEIREYCDSKRGELMEESEK